MKRILSILLCIVLMLGCVACKGDGGEGEASSVPANNPNSQSSTESTSSESGEFTLTAATIPTKFKNSGKAILCWGDSITQGMGMSKGYSYPEQLQGNIGDQYQVINAGVPTERASAIMSRAGAIDITLTNDMVFAAGQSSVTLDCYMFSSGSETIEYFGFGNGLKMDTIKIGDHTFSVTYAGYQSKNDGKYTFTRQNASSALTLKKGTKVTFDYSSQYTTDYCHIILMGANDKGFKDDIPAAIEKYKKMTALSDKYIVIVPFYYQNLSLKAEFEAAFGNHVVNVREYLINDAHEDYGLETTRGDTACLEAGYVPGTFTYTRNDCHMSDIGYKVLADLVYEKGVELGYWQ